MIKIKEIKQLVSDQIKLIDIISRKGTTSKIRKEANDYMDKLCLIVNSNLSNDEFIQMYKSELIECCSILYDKLIEDQKNLPSFLLRDSSKKEADRIMKIWKYIESKS
jgi:hypothetical protein